MSALHPEINQVNTESHEDFVEAIKMTRCVIVVGAGATLADFTGEPKDKDAPPLDSNFFGGLAKSDLGEKYYFKRILEYLSKVYSINLLDPGEDGLENILSIIYSDLDLYNREDRARAADAFRHLLRLLYIRIGQTTNDLNPGQEGKLYKLLCLLFEKGMKPQDITILTFNYDLQVEKTLHLLNCEEQWLHLGPVFCFPWCYALSGEPEVTDPPRSDRFNNTIDVGGVRVLKLHGSLNWYSRHRSSNPEPRHLLSSNRNLCITTRQKLAPDMLARKGGKRWHTFPVITPPVGNKAAFIHEQFRGLWSLARRALTETEQVIFYGYSCPVADVESSNMIRRALKNPKEVDIIDPSPDTFSRYAHITNLPRLAFYRDADAYLQHLKKNSQ